MQTRELDHATIAVANTTNISGTVTADEMNRSLRTGKEVSFWRNACSTVLGFLMAVGLLVALAPMPAHADNDKDKHEDNDKGIRAEIAALQAQVAALQGQVSALQKANTGQQNEIDSLQTSNSALQNQLAHAKNVLALDPFVRVDPNPEIGVVGPNIIFSGANIHIVSGSGATGDSTGLGNLIIGYDEDPQMFGLAVGGGTPLFPGDRGGSHNLVIGGGNKFISSGGLVAGELNTVNGFGASVTGGIHNTASGFVASVSGGFGNTASGELSSVLGGDHNTASGGTSSVSGGSFNRASGDFDSSVSGGQFNTASGPEASVSGGESNIASGFFASVSGGTGNTAGGQNTVVIGGQNVTDNNNNSIAPQPPFP